MERVAFSVAEFCARNSMSKSAVYVDIRKGRLRARKRGRSTIITLEDERSYNEALPVIAPASPSRYSMIGRQARVAANERAAKAPKHKPHARRPRRRK
jgi:hypothetical protein